MLQVGGALGGWALGAAVGPGTLLTALLVGPAVDLTTRTVFRSSAVVATPTRPEPLADLCWRLSARLAPDAQRSPRARPGPDQGRRSSSPVSAAASRR